MGMETKKSQGKQLVVEKGKNTTVTGVKGTGVGQTGAHTLGRKKRTALYEIDKTQRIDGRNIFIHKWCRDSGVCARSQVTQDWAN